MLRHTVLFPFLSDATQVNGFERRGPIKGAGQRQAHRHAGSRAKRGALDRDTPGHGLHQLARQAKTHAHLLAVRKPRRGRWRRGGDRHDRFRSASTDIYRHVVELAGVCEHLDHRV